MPPSSCSGHVVLCGKALKPEGNSSEWTFAEQLASSFHNPSIFLPQDLHAKYSAHVQIYLLPRAQVSVVLCGKGLLACSTKHLAFSFTRNSKVTVHPLFMICLRYNATEFFRKAILLAILSLASGVRVKKVKDWTVERNENEA